MIFRIMLLSVFLSPLPLHAQGGAAAPGHFCATYDSDSQPEDCSFTSLQMCQESVSGLGGWCAQQPVAPATAGPPLIQFPGFPAPAAAPAQISPPPFADQSIPPPPTILPDAPLANGN